MYINSSHYHIYHTIASYTIIPKQNYNTTKTSSKSHDKIYIPQTKHTFENPVQTMSHVHYYTQVFKVYYTDTCFKIVSVPPDFIHTFKYPVYCPV